MDVGSLLVYGALGLIVLLTVGALCAPVRLAIRLLVNACFGFLGLVIAGIFGSLAGLHIAVNPVSVALSALLGVPGLALAVLLQTLF